MDDDHFVLYGQKCFVVGATEADVFLVYCRTHFAENASNCRRLVSQAKKFATDLAWEVAIKAMQIMGESGTPKSIRIRVQNLPAFSF